MWHNCATAGTTLYRTVSYRARHTGKLIFVPINEQKSVGNEEKKDWV